MILAHLLQLQKVEIIRKFANPLKFGADHRVVVAGDHGVNDLDAVLPDPVTVQVVGVHDHLKDVGLVNLGRLLLAVDVSKDVGHALPGDAFEQDLGLGAVLEQSAEESAGLGEQDLVHLKSGIVLQEDREIREHALPQTLDNVLERLGAPAATRVHDF